ncbi:MAG: HAD family phosphatase [Leptolyngbyaceae cyanobacterium SM1_1_3]|nr:HAD family phosphatase [Leptolyngbyaceae cyanobacterium SM1_1_3]NJN02889.1 HAD family phosphatase [Leptolyngbyaceae cyanobacterium RM1_1_2]NJO11568.1 HAD family phosphatase [Leptolyngbyaceae cyanobacterium SL_1_1]
MSNIQLLVLDIDGTLSGRSNQIEPVVLQAIQAAQAKGIQVAIATGRMYCAALRFHQAVRSTLPLMSYQGALIKDPLTQRIHRHSPLSRQHTLKLLEHLAPLEAEQALSIHLYIDDQLHVREIIADTKDYAARSQIQPVTAGDLRTFINQNPLLEITKLLALSRCPEVVQTLLSELRQYYSPADLYFTSSVSTFFEATDPQANKGAAVKSLAEDLLGLSAAQVMTIGDNFNDLEMIQYAGIGVAMGEAPDEVKAAADWIAPSVEQHGVAAAIEKFLL